MLQSPARRTTVALCAALSLAIAPSAHAQTRANNSVEAMLRRADAAQEATDYAAALALYQQAYTAGHDPVVLFNIGRMHMRLSHWEEARNALRNFLEALPTAPSRGLCETMIRDAEREIEAARALAEQQRIAAEQARLRATSGPTPPVVIVRPAPVWPWAIVGVGGALAVGTAVTGALYAVTEARLFTSEGDCIRTPSGGIDCPAATMGIVGEARLFSGLTLGMGLGAALLTVGGVVAVVATRPRPERAAVTTVRAVPSNNGVTAVVGGQF